MSDATDAERDFLAISEKEIWEEARDRLQISVDAESNDRNQAKNDLRFCEGDQWDHDVQTTVSQETPELTINLTDALVRRVVNNMKQQRPRGKCHPVGDGAQIEIAELINGIGRHVEYRSEASVAYDTAGELAVKMGWGYWRLLTEYAAPDSFDQDIRILPIRNPFTVYVDPSAIMPTACDMNWALITVLMARTEYKRLYPRMPNTAWNDVGRDEGTTDWEDKEQIRLAEYFRIREQNENLYLLQNAQGHKFARWQSDLPAPETLSAGSLRVIEQRESSRRRVEWFRLNGTRVIERRILAGTWIPIIRTEGSAVDIDGKVHRRGMVRAMSDPQRMVNYGEVAKIKRLGLAPQAPWIAAEGQLDGHPEWTNSNREPVVVLTYKPVTVQTDQGEALLPAPSRQPPAQIEAGFAEFVQGMRTNLYAMAGMQNEPGADLQGEVVSGAAIQRRQGLSDQSHFQYYDNQTLAIAHTWRIMLEWIPLVYSEERMQRIIGEDGVPKMTAINQPQTDDRGAKTLKNDLSVGRYDVVMDTGPGYETKREEGAENLINLLKIGPLAELIAKVGADLVFRSIDHPYMPELADRIAALTPDGMQKVLEDLPSRARAIVQALMAQKQQLQQQLQAAQQETKFGLQKAHMAAVVKAHDTETRARTARDVEEIRAGAGLMKTNLEAHHHAAEAERMIERAEHAEIQGV